MELLIGHTGAPTAVLNRSVAGFIEEASDCRIRAFRDGPDGLLSGDWMPVEVSTLPDESRPGSHLGGGRRSTTEADITKMVDRIESAGINALVLIGGNGTMALLHAIEAAAHRRGLALSCVGIPKTIDNDLLGTDPAPGYASAASFVARTVADSARDHAAMRSIEPVRIIETMGRSTGWLTLAGSFAFDSEFRAHMVWLPEQQWDPEAFLRHVDSCLSRHDRALVVVSEGVAPDLTEDPIQDSNHATLLRGGVARTLAALVSAALDVPARGEVLGTIQRSASWAVSRFDAEVARESGRRAAALVRAGTSGVMADASGQPHPLGVVAGAVRSVPTRWRTPDPEDLSDFHAWLRPLISPLVHLNEE
ncbi:MAG: 6-phosphofructokinase [Propioniciclava sp.]